MATVSARRWGPGEALFVVGIVLWGINVFARGTIGLPFSGLDIMVIGIGLMLLLR